MQQLLHHRFTSLLQPDEVSRLLHERRPNHTLPAGLYTSEAAYRADLEAIWHHHWLLVGVAADVPEPGDCLTVEIGSSSVILLRDDDMNIRAFHNVCRHRGARLLPPGRSIVGKLVCPYHQWAYELTGELSHAPHMGVNFERDLHHLMPVQLRDVAGLLYASLSNDPPADFDDFAAVMEERLAPYNLRNAKVAHETDLIERGNWKLTIENNRECYHCAGNHPELVVSFHASDFGFDPANLTDEERVEAEGLARQYAQKTRAWESCGLASAAINKTRGHDTYYRTQRLIIAGAGESQTLDSKAAVTVPLADAVANGTGDLHLWGFNSWSHFMGDHAVVIMIFPVSPTETLVRTKWLVNGEAVEGCDYDHHNLTTVWIETNNQDAALVEMAQCGVESVGYVPGPYSPYTEEALDDFTTWYVEQMTAKGYAQ